jgi:uncharacterized paraquat-inducible protein A
MPAAEFACPKCKTAFSVAPGTVDAEAACPTCYSELRAHFFPSFFRTPEIGVAASELLDQADASCFYHPQKQAVRVCDGCGRLLCALCSVDMGSEHLCPSCISSGRKKGKLTTLENSRVRYDSIALSLAVLGMVLSFASLVLAPASIYIAIRHWKSPGGLVSSGSRIRMIIALVIASISLLVWGLIFGFALFGASNMPRHHHT